MKRDWEADELAEHWTLLPGEQELLANKSGATWLGFAVLLKFFQCEACFPQSRQEVPSAVVAFVARQVGVSAACYAEYDWNDRAIKYHQAQIRSFFGFREATVQDTEALAACSQSMYCRKPTPMNMYTSHGQRLNFFEGLKVERQ